MLRKKTLVALIPLILGLIIFSAMPVYAYYGFANGVLGIVYENGVPKEGIKVEVYREATMLLEGYGVNPDDSQGELGTDYTDINGEYHIAWLYSAGEWYIVKFYTPCGVIERRVQVFCATKTHLDICYTCEEGLSPGYWKKAFNAFANQIAEEKPKGAIKETYADLVMWTTDIDLASRSIPTPWNLPPLAEIDYDSDGTFEMEDAYDIFNDHGKPWNHVWIHVANWYNWAAGNPPYNG
ncbi:hypothetical protein KAT21_05315 [Candidatus Bathyarchaeota archaeon]|nr:hypothetical protein [Candidatus Bathyarchaeota archaeon]